MHALNTQILRISGLIGKKMSTVLSVDFLFLIDTIFVLCVSTKKVFDLLFEKGWQFNRRYSHKIKFPNILSLNS